MKCIERHIEYLLAKHDCAAVPGLGAFIVKHTSAAVKHGGAQIVAPRNVVAFNALLSEDDGLLASSVARKEGVSYSQALLIIAGEVKKLRAELSGGETIRFGRVGCFALREGALQFVPAIGGFDSESYYGLATVKMRSINADSVEIEEPKGRIVSALKTVSRVAASVVLLVALSFVLSTPLLVDENVKFAAVNSGFELRQPGADETWSTGMRAEAMCEGELVIAEPLPEIAEKTCDEGKYILVVASLSSEEQANAFIAENSATNLKVYKHGNRYKVYALRSDSFNDVISAREELLEKYPEAWVSSI